MRGERGPRARRARTARARARGAPAPPPHPTPRARAFDVFFRSAAYRRLAAAPCVRAGIAPGACPRGAFVAPDAPSCAIGGTRRPRVGPPQTRRAALDAARRSVAGPAPRALARIFARRLGALPRPMR